MSTAVKVNLEQMPYRELRVLSDNVSDALKRAKAREAADLRSKLEQIAQAEGYSLKDILPQRRNRTAFRHGNETAPLYTNPENPQQTWRGRGRRPGWFRDEMKHQHQHSA